MCQHNETTNANVKYQNSLKTPQVPKEHSADCLSAYTDEVFTILIFLCRLAFGKISLLLEICAHHERGGGDPVEQANQLSI